MSGAEIGALITAGVALLGVVLSFTTNRAGNRTNSRRVQVDIQNAQGVELTRLYGIQKEQQTQIDGLRDEIKKLQAADTAKQEIIDEQADEMEDMNARFERLRQMFVGFVGRVTKAWSEGHTTMPALTPDEVSILEDTLPLPPRTKGSNKPWLTNT